MKSVPKNIYINKLGDIVNKYNNTYHTTIKIKPIDVKSGRYFGSWLCVNVGDHVRILKYENILKFLNWSKELKTLKILFCEHLISDLTGEELGRIFFWKRIEKKNNNKKQNQKEFRVNKVIQNQEKRQ